MPSRRRLVRSIAAGVSVAPVCTIAGCIQMLDGSETTPTEQTDPTPTSPDATTETDRQSPSDAVDPDTLRSRTRDVVDLLVDGEFERLLSTYNLTPQVAAGLDADGLRSAWAQQTDSLGSFVEIATVEYDTLQGTHVTDAVVRFTRGRQVVRVAYAESGAIAGLRFFGAQRSYSPPDYADQSAVTEVDRSIQATDTCSLPATLTLPPGDDPVPGVVLVHGTGPNDRDETVGPNKPFRDLAWGLASRGIAVLRYDKRTHACTVDLASLTVDEKITDDALTALEVLRDHERVRAADTVVVGHSIGGMLVPRIAARDGTLAGGAMLAAPARPIPDLVREQTEYLLGLDGTRTDEESARLDAVERSVERIRSLDIDDDEVVLDLGGRPFWRTLGDYDQVETARELDVPLFVLQGGRDYQVSVERDFERWQSALAGRENVRFQSYDALNHLFVAGEGQSTPAEYSQPGNVDRAVIEALAGWIGDAAGS